EGDIEYRLGKEKSFKIGFKDWYDIEIEDEEWEFKLKEGNSSTLPEIYETKAGDRKGEIKEIRYYGEGEKKESVGILEYTDKYSTNLTLTYGAKN
nr:hypothetical protein [bacterium]